MGLFDGLFGDGGARQARKARKEIEAVQLPDIEKMRLELQDLVSQGQLSPEQAEAALAERSAMEGISLDPRLRNAQMQALGELQSRVDAGGLSDVDRANVARLQQETANQMRGQRESTLQNMRQRGMGGSGLELLAQLENQQSSAQNASMQAMELAALQQQQKMAALEQLGAMSGQVRNQDFDQAARVAQAQDAINQFNAQNRQQVNLTNTQARNTAQAQNLSERQRIADSNVGQRNFQQQYNKELAQRDYENRMRRAEAIAGARRVQGQIQAANNARDAGIIGAGIQAAAMAYGGPVAGAAAGSATSGGGGGGMASKRSMDY